MAGASWEEVRELLGNSDQTLIREVMETGATVDEIGEALSDLESDRMPRTELAAQLRRILEPLQTRRDEGTFSIMGVPI